MSEPDYGMTGKPAKMQCPECGGANVDCPRTYSTTTASPSFVGCQPDTDAICARCGCYRSAHGEGDRCEPVGWTFAAPDTDAIGWVALELCRIYDQQSVRDGKRPYALTAYRAGSTAKPFWDEMARAAIEATELADLRNRVAILTEALEEIRSEAAKDISFYRCCLDWIVKRASQALSSTDRGGAGQASHDTPSQRS